MVSESERSLLTSSSYVLKTERIKFYLNGIAGIQAASRRWLIDLRGEADSK